MSFLEQSVTLGTTDTVIYTCPTTLNGSAHGLVFSNITGTAATVVLKLFNQTSGTTTTIASGYSITANTPQAWPKPINLQAGDQIIASASAVNAVVAIASIYTASATPAATGFTPRGNWSNTATYNINDVVTLNGSSYIATSPNTNSQPPSGDWMLAAAQGATGPSYTLPVATATVLGGVKQGTNITIGADGTISGAAPYTLPVATSSTLGGVKQGSNTTIAADGTISISGLATVATSGSYNDLSNKPALAAVATSGSYTDLTNKPAIPSGTMANQNASAVAITGGTIDGTPVGATTPAAVHASKVSTAMTALGSVSGTVNLDCSAANGFSFTTTAATTLNPQNLPSSGRAQVVLLKITNGGAVTITYPAGSKYAGGTAPKLTSSGTDWLGMAYDPALSAWVIFVLGLNVK